MKNFVIAFLIVANISFAGSVFADESKPKYGPKDHPKAAPLVFSNEYFRSSKHPAPDFWSLISFYAPQFNDYACSVASVTNVINAARAKTPKTADDAVITQLAILDKVTAEQWKPRVNKEGVNGSHGVDLDQLGVIVEATFKAYGFPKASEKVIHVSDASVKTKAEITKALQENEKSSHDYIIANFNQQAFTDDADVGHIAPVGAYDAEKKRVLVLDPDRQYYEPYWISLDTFISGMTTTDKGSKKNRGYVWVQMGEK